MAQADEKLRKADEALWPRRPTDPEEKTAGTCQRCGNESQERLLRCTKRGENYRQLSWVCGDCRKQLAEKEADREEKLAKLLAVKGLAERRAAFAMYQKLMHGEAVGREIISSEGS